MVCSVVQVGRFADVQELRFHTAKRLDMGCSELKDCLVVDCQEWRFQAANHSDMNSAILQMDRYPEA